jgi:hypothetical protein
VSWYLLFGAQLGQCSSNPASTATRMETTIKEEAIVKGLSIKAIPNPSASAFTLQLASADISQKAHLLIYDISGRIIEERTVTPNTTVRVGSKYINGFYIAKLIQGKNSVTVKLIKIEQ